MFISKEEKFINSTNNINKKIDDKSFYRKDNKLLIQ